MKNQAQLFLQNGGTLQQLQTDYGVYAKRHSVYPNLVGLNYDQIESSNCKSHPIVVASRGTILDENNNWEMIAYPFERFFNLGEGQSNLDWSSSRVQEKVDGSLCIVYWYDNKWNVGTRGRPDANGNVNNLGFSFAELFWSIAAKQGLDEWLNNFHELVYWAGSNSKYTFMFELCSPYNRVVVQHKDNFIKLLGVRKEEQEISINKFVEGEVINEFVGNGVDKPNCLNPVKEYNFSSQEEMIEFAKNIVGTEGEGFVVVDKNFNRVKVKSDNYLALSHLKEGFGPRRVVEVIRTGELSEMTTFISSFPEMKPLFDEASSKYEALVSNIELDYSRIKDISLQKDFAFEANKTKYAGALFQIRSGRATSVKKYLSEIGIKSLLSLLNLEDTLEYPV